MHARIVTTAAGDQHHAARIAHCTACGATRAWLAGVCAYARICNPATETASGTLRFREHDAIAAGTEAPEMGAVRLAGARRIQRCRAIPCFACPSPMAAGSTGPNTGFARDPPGCGRGRLIPQAYTKDRKEGRSDG